MRCPQYLPAVFLLSLWPFCISAAFGQDAGQPLVLQLTVVEGEDAVHAAGSRSATPLTVLVSDQIGRPVPGAAVSFLMPSSGPAGIFASGLATEVLTTGKDGQASVRQIRWGNAVGQSRIRVTAMKGQARAGILIAQHIEAPSSEKAGGSKGRSRSVSKPGKKWVAIALVAAGAAVGGLVLGTTSGNSNGGPPVAASVSEAPGVQVGLPSITVGEP